MAPDGVPIVGIREIVAEHGLDFIHVLHSDIQGAELEMLEAGKLRQAARLGEIPFAAECFRYHAGWCSKIEGNTRQLSMAPANLFHAYTMREPIGVVGLITPYNGA